MRLISIEEIPSTSKEHVCRLLKILLTIPGNKALEFTDSDLAELDVSSVHGLRGFVLRQVKCGGLPRTFRAILRKKDDKLTVYVANITEQNETFSALGEVSSDN